MTNPVLFSNSAKTTLAGSITNVATTANLAPGSGALFPSPGVGQYFKGTFIDQATGLLREIVHVTGIVGDTITMVRAQEGTTALGWLAGDIFANFMTAGTAALFRQAAVAIDLSTTDVANVLPMTHLPASNTVGGIPAVTLHAGNPNGSVAGNASVNGASDMCYDTTNKALYVCTTTGVGGVAVWSPTALAAIPAGTVSDFAGTVAPAGYLPCDGSAVSRATFAALFSAIGTTWGIGDGSTTFNVPNLSRRTTIGSGGSGSGTIGNAVGNVGGEENHTLTVAELAVHNHTVSDPTHAHINGLADSGGGSYYGMAAAAGATSTPTDRDGLIGGLLNGNSYVTSNNGTGIGINNSGTNTPHNTMQPSAVVLKIIKT